MVVEARVVRLASFVVNHDETLEDKIDAVRGIHRRTDLARDGYFSDAQKGECCYEASAINFGVALDRNAVKEWHSKQGRVFASPKAGIDLLRTSPDSTPDHVMPLLMAGIQYYDTFGTQYTLGVDRAGSQAHLRIFAARLYPGQSFDADWWFLVLERTT